MGKKAPKAAYVVFRGRRPGVYKTWPECQAQVDGFPKALHQGYEVQSVADSAWDNWVAKVDAKLAEDGRAAPTIGDKNARFYGQSIHQPTEWIEPPTLARHAKLEPVEYEEEIGYGSSISERKYTGMGNVADRIADRMPGGWPENGSPTSSNESYYESKYFPPIHHPADLQHCQQQNQASLRAAPLSQPPFFDDLSLPPSSAINPGLKRAHPSDYINLTGKFSPEPRTGGKRLKTEGLSADDIRIIDELGDMADIHRSIPTPEVNSVEERRFLAELERKDTEARARKAAVGEKVELSIEQNEVVKMALRKNNIFLTGAAGSGKTVTLKVIISELRKKGKQIEVIAPTGIAALPLGGRTTYSFAGWNPDDLRKPISELLQKRKRRVVSCIEKLDVLIIEEISMVENQFLERLNLLFQDVMDSQLDADGRKIQTMKEPFGGKQVIFLGDFHQLPPVKPFANCLHCGESIPEKQGKDRICISAECQASPDRVQFKEGDKWAFRAPVWRELKLRHVQLEKIHRQKSTRFQDILNKIRNGIALTDEEWHDLERPKLLPQNAFSIRLMSRLFQVKSFNERELAAIKFQPNVWTAVDDCIKLMKDTRDPHSQYEDYKLREYRDTLKDHRFPDELVLKIGARVVLLHNLDHKSGLVNGSQGTVVGFQPASDAEVDKEFLTGEHKEYQRLCIERFREANMRRPMVRFANGITRAIPVIASAALRGGTKPWEQYAVCRTQVPLTLAWALSIHKSQGMTLEYVEVSSKDIFESGQLYVALSRATHLEGLNVTGFSREQLPMDKDVLQFYKTTRWEKLVPEKPRGKKGETSSVAIG